jgi:hypothetical protein
MKKKMEVYVKRERGKKEGWRDEKRGSTQASEYKETRFYLPLEIRGTQ